MEMSDDTREAWANFEEALLAFRLEMIIQTGEATTDAPKMGFQLRQKLDSLIDEIQRDEKATWR